MSTWSVRYLNHLGHTIYSNGHRARTDALKEKDRLEEMGIHVREILEVPSDPKQDYIDALSSARMHINKAFAYINEAYNCTLNKDIPDRFEFDEQIRRLLGDPYFLLNQRIQSVSDTH